MTDCFFHFISGFCTPHFIRLWSEFGEKICRQTWTLETQLKYSTLFDYLITNEEKLRTGVINSCLSHSPHIVGVSDNATNAAVIFCRIAGDEEARKCFV